MPAFGHELRVTFRSLRLTPAFSLVAVLVLAMGIGITAAMFSVVNGVLLRPLPYPDSDRLMWIGFSWPSLHEELLLDADYLEWRQGNRTLADLAAFGGSGTRGYNFTGNGAPQRISAARVTGNFLDVLRVQPFIGRNFTAEEDSPGGGLAIVLSYPFWMHQFAGERSAIGSKVVLDDQPYTVIGVLPKQFVFPGDLECDALVAQQLNAALDRKQGRALHGIGRLKPGVTIEQARSDIDRLLADAHRRFPFFYRSDNHAVVVPLQEHETGRAKLLLMVLFAAVGFVLLIACSNVATLLLTRTAGRQREIAVRLALGASRARLLRQFIMESSVLSCAGGLMGVLFAVGLVRVFRAYGSGQIPRAASVQVEWRVLIFAAAVSLLTGIGVGLVPALSASSTQRWHEWLKQAGAASTQSTGRMKRVLVVAEICVSMVLVCGAGLMLKSLWRLDHVPLGFEPQRLLTAHIRLAGPLHQAKESQVQFWERSIDAVRALPGVESVTISGGIPPNGSPELMTFSRSDAPPPEPGHRGDGIIMQPIDADYFHTLGIPLVQGNLFAEKQSDRSPLVAVVNEALARKYFANENVIGKRVMGHLNGDWKTIVGVVGDAKNDGLPGDVRPEVYEPYRQFPYISDMYLLVRTAAAPEYLTPEIGRAIARFDPSQPVVFTTVAENLDTFRSQPRFDTMLLSGFAGVALLLAMLGIYGVFSYATVQRTREIGVRMALGASPSAILWWTITSTLPLIVWGIIFGIGGSLILSRYLSSLLYEVRPRDATTFLLATLALGLTAFLAILLPASRAASLDPTISLRSE